MAHTTSRVRRGTLTLQAEGAGTATAFSCQPSAVSIVPDQATASGEDDLELLCGDVESAGGGSTLTAALNITALQDFTNPDGLTAYAWEHAGQVVDFVWNPYEAATHATDAWSGKVRITPLTVGGEVGARLTNEAEWGCTQLKLPTTWGGAYVIGVADEE